jgi:hypothetical protein
MYWFKKGSDFKLRILSSSLHRQSTSLGPEPEVPGAPQHGCQAGFDPSQPTKKDSQVVECTIRFKFFNQRDFASTLVDRPFDLHFSLRSLLSMQSRVSQLSSLKKPRLLRQTSQSLHINFILLLGDAFQRIMPC